MDVTAVRNLLAGNRFADLQWVAETGSTNDDLLRMAARGAPDGTVLVAGHQTAGRGRLNRRWEAPAGSSLLCSVLVRPKLTNRDWHLLTTAMGVAASQGIETMCGVRTALKWPNDLVVEDGRHTRKVAGVLAEASTVAGGKPAVVIGLGVNVRWPADLPADLAPIATSLNHLTGEPPSIESVMVGTLRAFDGWCKRIDHTRPAMREAGAEQLRQAYNDRSATIGRWVRVEQAAGVVEGIAVDVDRAGHLLVATGGGNLVPVAAGDVVHLRPASEGG